MIWPRGHMSLEALTSLDHDTPSVAVSRIYAAHAMLPRILIRQDQIHRNSDL